MSPSIPAAMMLKIHQKTDTHRATKTTPNRVHQNKRVPTRLPICFPFTGSIRSFWVRVLEFYQIPSYTESPVGEVGSISVFVANDPLVTIGRACRGI